VLSESAIPETAATQAPNPAVVLIPAYQPCEALLTLTTDLISAGVAHLVIVNDGSTRGTHIFETLRQIPECDVVVHSINLGKGRALKTGLNHILLRYPDSCGVVTMDADGQHATQDVLKISAALQDGASELLIGSRQFGRDIPFRSWLGNVITRNVLHVVAGLKLSDSQSGLRGLPMQFVPTLLRLDGEQYEYEMNMLLAARQAAVPIRQVPIQTIYLDNNSSSHFNPILDSMKIYFVLLRYGFTSLVTSFIDQVAFFMALHAGLSMAASLVVGRGVASIFNLASNRRFVFKSRGELTGIIMRYYSAMAIAGILAYTLINSAVRAFGWSIMTAKIVVESCLFLLSFVVNREFVFARPINAEQRSES
jgi:glycosyltransferase involved in cell wall biosynthesis